MSMVVTDRTIRLIHENYGFDHYLLKTPACDLRSTLALKIKRNLLHNIRDGCPAWAHDEARQKELLSLYGKYLEQYTPEEIEWYGLTWYEAISKIGKQLSAQNPILPYKMIFREKLIEQLRAAGDESQEFEIVQTQRK
jgi:large subunit ribosomal protein L28